MVQLHPSLALLGLMWLNRMSGSLGMGYLWEEGDGGFFILKVIYVSAWPELMYFLPVVTCHVNVYCWMFVIFIKMLLVSYVLFTVNWSDNYCFVNVMWSIIMNDAFIVCWQGPWSWPWLPCYLSVMHPWLIHQQRAMTYPWLSLLMRWAAMLGPWSLSWPSQRCIAVFIKCSLLKVSPLMKTLLIQLSPVIYLLINNA